MFTRINFSIAFYYYFIILLYWYDRQGRKENLAGKGDWMVGFSVDCRFLGMDGNSTQTSMEWGGGIFLA